MQNDEFIKIDFWSINKNLYALIDQISSGFEKVELLNFAFEFVVNGKLIDISKKNDNAVDKLYPICRELRKSKSEYLENGLVKFA